MEDWRLLGDYVENGSETAFTTLVNRHLGLVYSAALRQLGDPLAAEEVTQSVFCLLARKARQLPTETALVGWLYRSACFAAAKHWRTECRRRHREQEAAIMSPDNSTPDALWEQLAPHLDEAMTQLDEADRLAVLLRFFQKKPFQQIGQALGITEDAARMRVNRALEKLHLLLDRKKVACSSVALGAMLLDNTLQAVPATAARSVLAASIQAAQAASVPTLLATLLFWVAKAKLTTAVVTGLVVISAVMVGVNLFNQSRRHELSLASNSEPEAAVEPKPEAQPVGQTDSTLLPGADGRPQNSFAAASGTSEPVTAREFYERAQKYQREKKYDEALADYTKAIELLDQGVGRWEWFTDVYFGRASLLREMRDDTNAIAAYTRALEISPRNYSSRFNRARIYEDLRQWDKAIADYSEIVDNPETDFSHYMGERASGLAQTYEARGQIYQNLKDYNNAIADFTESIRADASVRDSMIVYWRRGLVYRRLQQYDKAATDADLMSERALQFATDPNASGEDRHTAIDITRFACEILESPLPYHLEARAAAFAGTGQFSNAINYQEQAIKALDPTAEEQRAAMQARLELYKAHRPLRAE